MSDILIEYEEFCLSVDETYNSPCTDAVCLMHYATGLAAETGEVLELLQKAIRKDKKVDVFINNVELINELGDVLWYLTRLANHNGISLKRVIACNRAKLLRRHGGE